MKSASVILMIIGILGIIASFINWYSGDSFSSSLLSMVCSISLIWGSYELKKANKRKSS